MRWNFRDPDKAINDGVKIMSSSDSSNGPKRQRNVPLTHTAELEIGFSVVSLDLHHLLADHSVNKWATRKMGHLSISCHSIACHGIWNVYCAVPNIPNCIQVKETIGKGEKNTQSMNASKCENIATQSYGAFWLALHRKSKSEQLPQHCCHVHR